VSLAPSEVESPDNCFDFSYLERMSLAPSEVESPDNCFDFSYLERMSLAPSVVDSPTDIIIALISATWRG
jgi:hypothetical protein